MQQCAATQSRSVSLAAPPVAHQQGVTAPSALSALYSAAAVVAALLRGCRHCCYDASVASVFRAGLTPNWA